MAKVRTCLVFFFLHTTLELYWRLNLAVQLQWSPKWQFVDVPGLEV